MAKASTKQQRNLKDHEGHQLNSEVPEGFDHPKKGSQREARAAL